MKKIFIISILMLMIVSAAMSQGKFSLGGGSVSPESMTSDTVIANNELQVGDTKMFGLSATGALLWDLTDFSEGFYVGRKNYLGSNSFFVSQFGDITATGQTSLENTLDVFSTSNLRKDVTIGAGSKNDGLVISNSAEVQTTDATQTSLDSLNLLAENLYHVEAFVVGNKNDGSARASYHIACTVYRDGSANAALQGTVTAVHSQESVGGWDATFTVGGTQVFVSVTGAAATTVEWASAMKYINVSED